VSKFGGLFEERFQARQFGGILSGNKLEVDASGWQLIDAFSASIFARGCEYRFCISTDLKDAFGNIPFAAVKETFSRMGFNDDAIAHLWDLICSNKSGVGIQQGNPLSPIVLNLLTASIMAKLESTIDCVVSSYIDDFYIMCRGENDAKDAFRLFEEEFLSIGMQTVRPIGLGPKETWIIDLGQNEMTVLKKFNVSSDSIHFTKAHAGWKSNLKSLERIRQVRQPLSSAFLIKQKQQEDNYDYSEFQLKPDQNPTKQETLNELKSSEHKKVATKQSSYLMPITSQYFSPEICANDNGDSYKYIEIKQPNHNTELKENKDTDKDYNVPLKEQVHIDWESIKEDNNSDESNDSRKKTDRKFDLLFRRYKAKTWPVSSDVGESLAPPIFLNSLLAAQQPQFRVLEANFNILRISLKDLKREFQTSQHNGICIIAVKLDELDAYVSRSIHLGYRILLNTHLEEFFHQMGFQKNLATFYLLEKRRVLLGLQRERKRKPLKPPVLPGVHVLEALQFGSHVELRGLLDQVAFEKRFLTQHPNGGIATTVAISHLAFEHRHKRILIALKLLNGLQLSNESRLKNPENVELIQVKELLHETHRWQLFPGKGEENLYKSRWSFWLGKPKVRESALGIMASAFDKVNQKSNRLEITT
jgi:hypothetical protein